MPPPNSGYAPQNRPNAAGWPNPEPPKGLAIASLVCGVSGVVTCLGIPSVLAVIFGHIALSRVRQGIGGGRELAIAGLVTGYIIIGIFVLVMFIFAVAFFAAA